VSASFRKQLGIVTRAGAIDPRRLVAAFELSNTTLEDARTVRSLVLQQHLAGVVLWRDYAKQGGDCADPVNLKIACLAFGRCG
jgi:hypothetical protein